MCRQVDREERPDVDRVYMTFVQVAYLYINSVTNFTDTGSSAPYFHV